ncbi:MAG: amino acid adenylation domain-containing protein, partial [Bacteroidota bacterium]
TVQSLVDYIAQNITEEVAPVAPSHAPSMNGTPQEHNVPVVSSPAHPSVVDLMQHQLNTINNLFQKQLDTLGGSAPLLVEKKIVVAKRKSGSTQIDSKDSVRVHKMEEERSLTFEQQLFFDDLLEKYQRKTAGSKKYFATERRHHADLLNTIDFRFATKEFQYPIVSKDCHGARFTDIDGNEYIDMAMGFGVNYFGNNPEFITKALADNLGGGHELASQNLLVAEITKSLYKMTGMERYAFLNSGTEAVMTAMRIARAVSKKDKIVIFNGFYHGTFDGYLAQKDIENGGNIPLTPGTPQAMVEDIIILSYGQDAAIRAIQENASEIAAVLLEPVQSRKPEAFDINFLQKLRAVTASQDIALIFDEIITGFRSHPGGVQAIANVQADMATYGKVIGGGMPIGIVAGSKKYMDAVDGGEWHHGDDSHPMVHQTFFGGTFSKHPLTLVSIKAALTKMEQEGPALQDRTNELCTRMRTELNAFFESVQVPIRMFSFSSLFRFKTITPEYNMLLRPIEIDLFFYALIVKGVYSWERRICFLSTAHTDRDIDEIIRKAKEVTYELLDAGFFPNNQRALERTKKNRISLSDNQKQLFILHNISKGGALTSNLTVTLQAKGHLDVGLFKEAVQMLGQRHEALRIIFDKEGAYQEILPAIELPVQVLDNTESEGSAIHSLERVQEKEIQTAFDIFKGPLFRVTIVKDKPDACHIIFSMHHLISDGWSVGVIWKDLGDIYTNLLGKEQRSLMKPLQFSSYLQKLKTAQYQQQINTQKHYWIEKLDGLSPTLMPFANEVEWNVDCNANRIRKKIAAAVFRPLIELGNELGCTLYMSAYAIFAFLLYRLNDEKDIFIEMPVSGRSFETDKFLVGACADMQVLAHRIDPKKTFPEFLVEIKRLLSEAYDHQECTFSHVKDEINLKGKSYPQISFNLDANIIYPNIDGVSFAMAATPRRHEHLDCVLDLSVQNGELQIECDYNTDALTADAIEHFLALYQELIAKMVHWKDKPLAEVFLLPETKLTIKPTAASNGIEHQRKHQQEVNLSKPTHSKDQHDVRSTINEVWEKHLGQTKIHPDNNFFDLGGQSLAAIKMVNLLRRGLQVDLELKDFFKYPTINGLTNFISSFAPKEEAVTSKPVENKLQLSVRDQKQADPLPQTATFVELFEMQVRSKPFNTALVFEGGEVMTYQGLNEKANQLANHLIAAGVVAGDIIAVKNKRSTDMIMVPLAVMKTGAAYLPIDINCPEERTNYFLKDSSCKLLIDDPFLAEFESKRTQFSNENLGRSIAPSNLCYIIYTSGSTGAPKGVMIEHRSLLDYVQTFCDYFSLTQNDTVLEQSSIAFDHSVEEIFPVLGVGGILVIANTTKKLDQLFKVCEKYRVSILTTNPYTLEYLNEVYENYDFNFRVVLSGGDTLRGEYISKLYQKFEIYNTYGPTESTVCASFHKVMDLQSKVPIGLPINNRQIYILEPNSTTLVGEGKVGELCIAGLGLARGYINRPEVTAEKFIPHPFSDLPGERLYRTGDHARWLPNGNLEFLGRIDSQVKIGGLRVELGEIESALVQHPLVKKAVVLAKKELTTILIAYLQVTRKVDKEELKSFLSSRLQNHMMPNHFIFVDEFPLNQNDKIDKKALLNMELSSPQTKQSEERIYPVSLAQKRLWTLLQIEEDPTVYNMFGTFEIEGALKPGLLRKSIEGVIERHEVLRTNFIWKEGAVYQCINEYAPEKVSFKYRDISRVENPLNLSEQIIRGEETYTFDLERSPLVRAGIIRLADQKFIFYIQLHHIIADGYSIDLLLQEVSATYEALSNGNRIPLLPLTTQYKDFAHWQNQQIENKEWQPHANYWKQKLDHLKLAKMPLPTDVGVRPQVKKYRGATAKIWLKPSLANAIFSKAREKGMTPFMILLSGVNALLNRYTNHQDIVLGTSVLGRNEIDFEQQIGFYINLLPLSTKVDNGEGFEALLENVRLMFLEALTHQDYPFDLIVKDLVLKRNLGSSPVFEVYISMNDVSNTAFNLNDFTVRNTYSGKTFSKYDLSFNFIEEEQNIGLALEYDTDLFLPTRIERMLHHFEKLMSLCLAQPQLPLLQLDYLPEPEKAVLLKDFKGPETIIPKQITVPDLFAKMVKAHPQKIALVDGAAKITYRDLDKKSNQLARYLMEAKDVQIGDRIMMVVEPGYQMVLAIMAVLKAGGVYVPVDPDYPKDRIMQFADSCQPKLVLTDQLKPLEGEGFSVQMIPSVEDPKILKGWSTRKLSIAIPDDALAYIIYTSGSTGEPKGVMINHVSLFNRIEWMWNELGLDTSDVILQKTSFTFDVSVWEFFLPLCFGARLVCCPRAYRLDMEKLVALIRKEKVTTLHFVPSALSVFQDHLSQCTPTEKLPLQRIIASGEALKAQHVKDHYCLMTAPLINLYGPTEATVDVSIYTTQPNDQVIPIGKPIDNTELLILDHQQQLCPLGVAGEIAIGGIGLAQGYLNNQELTDRVFITHPYRPGEKLYLTGDIGQLREDGHMIYLGRKDHQVKIRGFRIELGEIEAFIQQVEMVRSCVVLAKKNDRGDQKLVAYITLKASFAGHFDSDIITQYLESKLPNYMIPTFFEVLEKFPTSASGKINRKLLPEPTFKRKGTHAFVAPRNDVEQTLVNIWKKLLALDHISTDDNFFELGGDSIIAIQVVGELRKLGISLSPRVLFQNQTVVALSNVLTEKQKLQESLEQGELEGKVPILPIQRWFLDTKLDHRSHFNQSILFNVDKNISFEIIALAVDELIRHHDALRLQFQLNGTQWEQQYGKQKTALESIEILDATASFSSTLTELCDNYQKTLDIQVGRTSQFVWIKTPDSEIDNRLLIIVHHLGIDGVSWRILISDLQSCLQQALSGNKVQLGMKGSSYREWGQFLEAYASRPKLEKQISYWKTIQEQFEPFIPTGKEAKATQQEAKTLSFYLEPAHTKNLLKKVHHAYRTEISDFLLAALSQTLGAWSGNKKITIALENHGREELDSGLNLSQSIGWFTTLFPTSFFYDQMMSAKDLLIATKERRSSIPDKGIGYGILKYLHPTEEVRTIFADKNPWDLLFNYLGQLDAIGQDGALLSIAKESAGEEISADYPLPSGLEVIGSVVDRKLKLDWSFSPQLYDEDTIQRLGAEMIENLERLIQHCLKIELNHPTPADFGLSQVMSPKEFDQFWQGIDQNITAIYPLSSVQKGMLFHGLYDKKSDAYIEQITFDLHAVHLDLNLLNDAWNQVVRNHSVLRSSFFYEGLDFPLQMIVSDVNVPFVFEDLSHLSVPEQEKTWHQWISDDGKARFDFNAGPLMRIGLLKLDAAHYKMVWTYHHILLDGWSLPIIMEELFDTYDALQSGEEMASTKEDLYQDYIDLLQQQNEYKEANFWKKYLSGFESPTLLPFVGSDDARNKGEATTAVEYLNFDSSYVQAITDYVQSNQITVNTLVQGIWSILLSKYTNRKDVVFGVTVSGRTTDLADIENKVGLFINTLPLRAKLEDNQKITDWLSHLQESQSGTRDFQHTGVNEIKNWCGLSGDLFDSILVFQNYPLRSVLSNEWSVSIEDIRFKSKNNYLFSITAAALDQSLDLEFEYKVDLIDQQTARKIKNHFKALMDQIIQHGVTQLGAIALSPHEKLINAQEFDQVVESVESETLVGLFEQQVATTPDQVAVTFQEKQLTFAELNREANRLAAYLSSTYQIQADDLIGVMMDRSEWAIIALLGILKSGAAFVPIDTDFPKDRKQFIIEDTALKLLMVDANYSDSNDQWEVPTFELDTQLALVESSGLATQNSIEPNNLAYVIYTSGSTGQPKGVMIEHQGIVNTIKASAKAFEIKNKTNCLQFAALTFDASVSEIFASLLSGGNLFIVDQKTKRTPDLFLQYMEEHAIEVATLPPVYVKTLDVKKLKSLKVLITAGEAADKVKANDFLQYGAFRNAYGPTEASICATVYSVEKGGSIEQDNVPIGRPIDQAEIFLLDENQNIVSEGDIGEICIGGAGVARGYLNRPELTAEKFIVNPFDSRGESRLYRTNDLGRWLPDGNLAFHGRKDYQVKIRGYRVELGEIEMVLNQHQAVEEAVVLLISDERHPYLLAYYKGEQDLDKNKLSTYLTTKLPQYMVPAVLIRIAQFPVTNSGKIDRNL